jgi:DNA-binding LytR/AlgR family response regulator
MDFLFVLLYLGIIFAVIEINVVLFAATGLDRPIARFQVISMLTATGFTTGESELIIKHPVRRKLGAFLILFGAFSLAVIISAISNLLADTLYTKAAAYLGALLLAVVAVLRTPMARKQLERLFNYEVKKHDELADLPIADVMLFGEEDEIVEIEIQEDSSHLGSCFSDILEKDKDIMVLFISRDNEKIRSESYSTELKAGDKAILYGDRTAIREEFDSEIIKHKTT